MPHRPVPSLWQATALCLAFAAPVAAQEVSVSGGQRFLSVSGEGSVSAAPDLAALSVGVSAQAPTAGEALDQMGKSLDTVLQTLAAFGIADADIQTEQLFLEQQFNYDGPVPQPLGFVATSTLAVDVRDLDRVGELIDGVVMGGANRLNGITFGFDDPADLLDEARSAAVTEAARRAEVYATAAGVDLGELVAITDGGGDLGSPVVVEQMLRDVPVAGGSVTLSATATLTYRLAD